jgi:hypothetical protein
LSAFAIACWFWPARLRRCGSTDRSTIRVLSSPRSCLNPERVLSHILDKFRNACEVFWQRYPRHYRGLS